ncbi:hypothetical protein VCHENC02_1567A, partial [Vibrio harveyi]|jgi:hypothetical protein
MTRV